MTLPRNSDSRRFCLTLDLENDWYFEGSAMDHLTLEHLDNFIALINQIDVPLSTFVVGKTLEQYPEKIDHLSAETDCEFHLHSYSHEIPPKPDFETDLLEGVEVYRDHFGSEPEGYRAPKGAITLEKLRILDKHGFRFDSSVFPSFRPGVYNNLRAPLTPYKPDGIDLIEVPLGVFRGIRVPISHSYLKAGGWSLCWGLQILPLANVVVYNLHLQDLYQTDSHNALDTLKRIFMKRNISISEDILRENIHRLIERGFNPTKISEIAKCHLQSIIVRGDEDG